MYNYTEKVDNLVQRFDDICEYFQKMHEEMIMKQLIFQFQLEHNLRGEVEDWPIPMQVLYKLTY